MGLQDLHLKLKAFWLKRFHIGGPKNKKKHPIKTNPSWMIPVSHGYHVVEGRGSSDESNYDSVVVQREQIEELELWFFGVFNPQIGDTITKYMQSHLFDKKSTASRIRRMSKETMRKAHLSARAKIRDAEKENDGLRVGSASAMVINGEKLVFANMGDYRAVVCRDGVAHQISSKRQKQAKRHWSRRLVPGSYDHLRLKLSNTITGLCGIEVRMLGWGSGNAAGTQKLKSSELCVGSEGINSETEFVILASTGVWEVMNNQEAVNLIRHLEDAEEAAECLAKEALTRMSKSSISCLVFRFD